AVSWPPSRSSASESVPVTSSVTTGARSRHRVPRLATSSTAIDTASGQDASWYSRPRLVRPVLASSSTSAAYPSAAHTSRRAMRVRSGLGGVAAVLVVTRDYDASGCAWPARAEFHPSEDDPASPAHDDGSHGICPRGHRATRPAGPGPDRRDLHGHPGDPRDPVGHR